MWMVDYLYLLYPRLCAACNEALVKGERGICTRCRSLLHYTKFHNELDNPVAQLFWGRIPVEYATAYIVYRKGSRSQKILHNIKYRNHKHLAVEAGRWFGWELRSSVFNRVDMVVPVPLHPRKLQKRGFNQSELIARGIAESMGKPFYPDLVRRVTENPSQTNKGRYERWTNVEDIFMLSDAQKVINKHILIVDDVITTGSTLEACGSAFLKAPGTKVSIAVLAMA